jgi:crotonobetainyl-CoA:carnitine CoA-transferase CaiB-like acyl-CoA transferase
MLERAELASDARFRDNPARAVNADALDAIIEGVFATLARDALIARLEGAGIAYGAVNEVADLSRHPALRRIEVGSPSGPVRLAAPPARDDGPVREYRPVPALDEHGPALRREFALS